MKDMVPEIAAPYYLEGMIDLAKGNENKALQSFEEMKQRDPDDPLVDDLIKMLKASN
jgi:outer membrane protein assembly factor BamD (BamD/ComL family)